MSKPVLTDPLLCFCTDLPTTSGKLVSKPVLTDPLLSHLLDIACDPASENLILGGGFGIRVKQVYLRETGQRTLIPQIPEARATQDLDFFLQMVLFIQKEKGEAVRALLNRLAYEEHVPQFQFAKPFDAAQPTIRVKVDLLARTPLEGEGVRLKSPRAGALAQAWSVRA